MKRLLWNRIAPRNPSETPPGRFHTRDIGRSSNNHYGNSGDIGTDIIMSSSLALDAQAVVSENSEEYLLVMVIDGERHYFASNFEFAESVNSDLHETIDSWKLQSEARDRQHHHHDKPKQQDPPQTQE